MTTRFYNWCFTLNNYTSNNYDDILNIKNKYLIIGKEIGECGTPHLQGYVEFKDKVSLKKLKKFNNKIHWEIRRGTAKQASEYCMKGGDFVEIGTISQQGKRTDLESCISVINAGYTIRQLADEYAVAYIKYHKGLEKYRYLLLPDRCEPPIVIWLWGLAGTGKTLHAFTKHADTYIKDGTQWWDGYENNEAIIIDDFDGKWPYRDLLRLLDRYPYQGQTKGGYIKITSKYIYITCEFHPKDIFNLSDNHYQQILRRITEIKEFKND